MNQLELDEEFAHATENWGKCFMIYAHLSNVPHTNAEDFVDLFNMWIKDKVDRKFPHVCPDMIWGQVSRIVKEKEKGGA